MSNPSATAALPGLERVDHVSKFDLTQPKTREYVTELLVDGGSKRQLRITATGMFSRVRTLRASLGSAAVLRRVRAFDLDPHERAAIADEIDKLKDVLRELSRAVRERTKAQ